MWTDETVEQLIGLYKQQPALWDPKNMGYRNRLRKDNVLKEIGDIMNLDVIDVERKINVLNTQFRRAHRKAVKLRAAGMTSGDVGRNEWHWYKSLMFLEKRYFPRKPIEGVIQMITQQDVRPAIEEFESSSDDGVTNGIKIEYPDVLSNKRPREEEEPLESRELNLSAANGNTFHETSAQMKDECEVYGELLAIKLKKFDDRTRITVMHEIDNIIFRTRMNYH